MRMMMRSFGLILGIALAGGAASARAEEMSSQPAVVEADQAVKDADKALEANGDFAADEQKKAIVTDRITSEEILSLEKAAAALDAQDAALAMKVRDISAKLQFYDWDSEKKRGPGNNIKNL